MLYLAGFDVKDVTMTDLISGRETLEDINMVVYCGGFSNSDVLGSAKGWAGSFLFNPKAKAALDNFYAREDTLSLGVCNGCQLMMELGLITPEDKKKGKMLHNDSHKFESNFLGVTVPMNRSVMFGSLSGSKLGIWVAHGEGKFSLPYPEDHYNVVLKYSYDEYPGNPNGSDYSVAGIASQDGRHLAMMPHLERACFPWENAYYPLDRKDEDQITPWMEAFVNAASGLKHIRKHKPNSSIMIKCTSFMIQNHEVLCICCLFQLPLLLIYQLFHFENPSIFPTFATIFIRSSLCIDLYSYYL